MRAELLLTAVVISLSLLPRVGGQDFPGCRSRSDSLLDRAKTFALRLSGGEPLLYKD